MSPYFAIQRATPWTNRPSPVAVPAPATRAPRGPRGLLAEGAGLFLGLRCPGAARAPCPLA